MPNEEMKQCNGDCTDCDEACNKTTKEVEAKSNTMPNGEKVVSFSQEPTLVDVAKMLLEDNGFKKITDGASIVATRVLKHANGQDAVLQIFFHKKVADKIIVTNEMPKSK